MSKNRHNDLHFDHNDDRTPDEYGWAMESREDPKSLLNILRLVFVEYYFVFNFNKKFKMITCHKMTDDWIEWTDP